MIRIITVLLLIIGSNFTKCEEADVIEVEEISESDESISTTNGELSSRERTIVLLQSAYKLPKLATIQHLFPDDNDVIPLERLKAFPALVHLLAIPGINYPNYTSIPQGLNFKCTGRSPGYYSDTETDCQVYHICLFDGRRFSQLCGIGTIFNQQSFVCDHWYHYDCRNATDDYIYNEALLHDVNF